MARAQRSSLLQNRTNRLTLVQGEREFLVLGPGLSLGYRRTQANFGTWQARVWHLGKFRFETLGSADDYQEADGKTVLSFLQAQKKAQTFYDRVISGGHSTGKDLTVGDVCENYMRWFANHRKGVSEAEGYFRVHILPALGPMKINRLDAQTIRQWHDSLANAPARKRTSRFDAQKFRPAPKSLDEKRARRATANRIMTCLKAALNKAYRDGLISDDSAWRRVRPFGKVDQPRVRFLSDAEALRLLNSCENDLRDLVQAALLTGCRYGELSGLQASEVNLRMRSIYVAPGKSGLSRHVPLNPEATEFFRTILAGKSGESFVFTLNNHRWGKSHHLKMLIRACRVAKINPPVRFHELRHTYASQLAQAGVDLLTISKLLGHRDTRITSRVYAHLCDRTLANAVLKLPSFEPGRKENLQKVREVQQ